MEGGRGDRSQGTGGSGRGGMRRGGMRRGADQRFYQWADQRFYQWGVAVDQGGAHPALGRGVSWRGRG